ncbi:hypothetical protein DSC_04015 [Pseudoxanthomonas spadix BD-a59]|uniref:Uncharacterized protein n=1 Tax=Pseudoxanthomonas spadix (strain BD-a59) TaxID=1045855 RepID=G7UNV5_PSEUP|nr:hypothetical protein DSC_04015 [Pseudoxanthomonas spadix BD-a59]
MFAERFPASEAVHAVSTGTVEPGHSHSIAFPKVADSGADRHHVPHALMSRNERRCRLDGPVTLGGMEIGMAYTRRRDLHENLSAADGWHWGFLDDEGLPKCADHCSFHGFLHDVLD